MTVQDLLTSPWLHFLAAVITIFTGLLAFLRHLQSRSLSPEQRAQEDEYLRGLLSYLHNLNRRATFDETLFVERTFQVKNEYQPRSFFVARHKSFFSKLPRSSGTESKKDPKEGYRTKGLQSEILRSNEPLIVLGEPGSGKSVSARQLATQVATQSLSSKGPNRLLPVFISLAEYTAKDTTGSSSDFYAWLRSLLGSRSRAQVFSTAFLLGKLDELLDSGRLLLVLDGLDEMPPGSFKERSDKLSDFMLRYSRNAFVVTCRSNDFADAISGREAYLDKLTSKEIQAFIQRRRPLLNGVSPKAFFKLITTQTFSLRQVIDNPFYLNLIIYFYSIKQLLPENYPLLFREICNDWVDRESTKQIEAIRSFSNSETEEARRTDLREQILLGLSAIGFAVSNSAGFGTFIDIAALKVTVLSLGTPRFVLDLALKIGERGGMLDVDKENGQARFIHHKFQEYFAAEYLSKSLSCGDLEYSLLPSICDNIWWEEVTTILVSIASDPQQIVAQLCTVNGSDLTELRSLSLFTDKFDLKSPLEPNSFGLDFDIAERIKNHAPEGAGAKLGSFNNLTTGHDSNYEDVESGRDPEWGTIFRRNLWLSARCIQMLTPKSEKYKGLLRDCAKSHSPQAERSFCRIDRSDRRSPGAGRA